MIVRDAIHRYLSFVLVGSRSFATAALSESLAALPADFSVREAASDFSRVVLAFVRRRHILDGDAVLTDAYAWLPPYCAAWRALKVQTRRRHHAITAMESAAAGFAREAFAHWRQVAACAPAWALHPRTSDFLRARWSRDTAASNRRLEHRAVQLHRMFTAADANLVLCGSLAISLHAGRFVKRHADVDWVANSREDFDRAVDALLANDWRLVASYDWEGFDHATASMRAFDAADGSHTEVAYMPEWPIGEPTIVRATGSPLAVVSPAILRDTYATFLYKKPASAAKCMSAKLSIHALDALLGRPRARAVLPQELTRVPVADVLYWQEREAKHDAARWSTDAAAAR